MTDSWFINEAAEIAPAACRDTGLWSALQPHPGPQALRQCPTYNAELLYPLHTELLSVFYVPGSGLEAGAHLEGSYKPTKRV